MNRNRFLLRVCGVGLAALLTPLAAFAQGTGMGTGGTGTGNTGATGATGVSPAGSGQTQGTGQTTTSQGVSAALGVGLTTKVPTFAASSGAGSATSIPSNVNPFVNNYVNPLSLGLPSLYQTQYGAENVITQSGGPKGKFTYLYVAAPTATQTTTQQQNQTNGFTTYGQIRNPVYQTTFSEQIPIVQHNIADLHTRVREAIQNSSRLAGKNGILVNLDGDTIVLSGAVTSEHERRLAEALARITPGVNGVPLRNDITVVQLNK